MKIKSYILSDRHLKMMISLLLILATLIPYGQIKNFDFVGYDDQEYITENIHVQKGLTADGIIWAFTTFHSSNWHPLTWLSHMLDCELYGLNPMGHHWTNLIFHVINTVLLFLILEMMTGAIWRSAFVAALFALHPLHVESVAWISERKDVLSTFFGFLMIGAYYYYVKAPDFKKYASVIVFFSLGLMSKPMLVTFPFVLFLLDFWPLERFHYKDNDLLMPKKITRYHIKKNYSLILEKIPLFILSVISCVLTYFAQKSWGSVQTLAFLSLKSRITNALVSYINYILKMFWPSKLAVFYPHPGNSLPTWQIFAAVLLVTCVCFLAIKAANTYPYIVMGMLWYFGTLVPVIGLVQVGEQAMADRYTYIPLIGLFVIFSWGISDLFRKWQNQKIYLGLIAMIILSFLTVKTFYQIRHWKNGVTLFEYTIKVTKNNYKAHNNLATSLGPLDVDRAIFHYKEAVRIYPKYVTALRNLGIALYNKGNYEEAVLYFTRALKIDPQKIDIRMDLANIFFLQGKHEKAITQYKEILKTDSKNANAHYNLALMLSDQKKIDQAESHYREALKINPKHEKAHYNLGNMELKKGKLKEAFTHFAEAIKIKPDFVQAYDKIGLILLKQGKLDKAKVFFSKAIQLDPKYSEALKNLETVNRILSTGKS